MQNIISKMVIRNFKIIIKNVTVIIIKSVYLFIYFNFFFHKIENKIIIIIKKKKV